MNDRLAVMIGDEYLNLPDDFSIDIEDVNPLFNEGDAFSYPTTVPLETNRHVLKNIDDIQSDKRLVDFDNKDMTIIADGNMFRTGKVQTSEDEELKDEISFSMVSNIRTFSEMIGDLSCPDIPVKDKIQIGECIGNVQMDVSFRYQLYFHAKDEW
ncbi:hypothetical protein [Bacteroides sp.]|uniref:hypothetical protein n=1 Tax=Bacteroides sp. TaxID=29523 RepID=UPI0026346699|nr:hypothetical protein [Bacteroides sp.]MDD3037890.1 hypothetical protein [Bacteroides sp.]